MSSLEGELNGIRQHWSPSPPQIPLQKSPGITQYQTGNPPLQLLGNDIKIELNLLSVPYVPFLCFFLVTFIFYVLVQFALSSV